MIVNGPAYRFARQSFRAPAFQHEQRSSYIATDSTRHHDSIRPSFSAVGIAAKTGMAFRWRFAACLAAVVALAWSVSSAHAALGGSATQNGITITQNYSSVYYVDTKTSPYPEGFYAAYQVTNQSGVALEDVWVTLGNFSGSTVYLSLANNENGIVHLGALAAGSSKTAYFLLQVNCTGFSSGNCNISSAQSATARVYSGPPTANLLASLTTNDITVSDTIAASANKVNSGSVSTTTPSVGSTFSVTVNGSTGTIGGANIFALSPQTSTSFPAGSFKLTSVTLTFSNGGTGTYTDLLQIPSAVMSGIASADYTVTYTYRVTGTTTASTSVAPIAYISSGAQIKHTTVSTLANIPAIQPASNTLLLSMTASPVSLGLSGGTVTYTVHVTNSGSAAASLDEFFDVLASSPDAESYLAGSSTFAGNSIADPAVSGSTLAWSGTFTIPASGSADLTFQTSIPATLGSYADSLYGVVAGSRIDTTLSTADNAPATTSVKVTSLQTTTISISNIPSGAMFGGGFTPAYSYVGDGTPSVTSSTVSVCTVSGGAVSYVGAGTCTLTASATTGTNYAATSGSPQSFSVSRASPTISIANLPTVGLYGGSFTPSYNYSGDGTPSVASNSPSVCTVSGGVVNYVGIGTCSLTASSTATTDYNSASGSAQTFSVVAATTATTISPSLFFGMPHVGSQPVPGQSITVSANVVDEIDTNTHPTGTVSFTDSVMGSLGSVTLANGTASLTLPAAVAGPHTITAAYSPSGSLFGASSDTTGVAFTVNAYDNAAAAFTVVPASNPAYISIPDTLTITALDAYGNTIANFADSVALSSTDGEASFSNPTFHSGVGTATVTFAATGSQTVAATDSTQSAPQASGTSASITVLALPNYVVTDFGDDSVGAAGNCPANGTGESCTLRDALAAAASTGGGAVTVPSSAPAQITLSSTLTMPNRTRISGPTTGSGRTLTNLLTIYGGGTGSNYPVFTIPSGSDGAIDHVAIRDGNAAHGGGIENQGSLVLTDVTLAGNSASGDGGGIDNSGTLTINGSTLSGNSAGGNGGGIHSTGVLTINYGTLSGNFSASSGGGVYNGGTLTARNSTVASNTAASAGGGIYNGSVTAVANTIVASNTRGTTLGTGVADDFDGTAYSDGNGNVLGTVNESTLEGTAIHLAPLGNYGGPTQSMIPLPISPAFCAAASAGIPSGWTVDQRGFANTNSSYPGFAQSACVDAGAVQSAYALSFSTQPSPNVTVGDTFNATVTLSENGAVFTASAGSVTLTLNGAGVLGGVTTGSLSGGSAGFTTLTVDTTDDSDTLTASLALRNSPALSLTAISDLFTAQVANGTATTTTASSAVATYSPSAQPVALSATVSSSSTVNIGTVTFRVYDGATPVGSPVTSGTVSNGQATVAYTLPAGTPAGTYTIHASYSASQTFDTSNDNTHTLTITQATASISIANLPASAIFGGSFIPVLSYGGDGVAVVTSSTPLVCTTANGVVSFVGTGTCTLTASATAGQNYAAVTGAPQSLTVANAALTFNTAALAFLDQPVGTTSAAQTLIVSNPYSFAVTMGSIAAGGDFSAASACPAIAALSNCSVNVTFTPSATGARSGTLSIHNANSAVSQAVALSGTGTTASILVSPASLNFGSQEIATTSVGRALTIVNAGTASILITNAATTGDFAAQGNCSVVPAGSSCSLTITFTPTAIGSRTGSLTLTGNAGAVSQVIPLSGVGTVASAVLSPGAQAFPATLVGATSQALTATLSNTSSAPLTGISISVLGDFTQTNDCPNTLPAGSVCTLSVVYAPKVAGAESGLLTVTDGDGTQTISLTGTGLTQGASISTARLIFGTQLVGTSSLAQTVVFTNTGTAAITVSSVVASQNFTLTTNCTGSIAPGTSCGVNVTFEPTVAGPLSGTLTIVDSSGTRIVTAQGQGVSASASVAPSFVQFGAQIVGTVSQAQTLNITNNGSAPLSINAITASSNFAASSQCPAVLAVGATCLVSVRFEPAATGDLYGSLQLSNTADDIVVVVPLQGQGTLAGIATTPSTVFFGSVPTGTASSAQTVTVWNTGTAALEISAVKATGDFAETDTCTANAVAAGGFCVIGVTMTPTTTGTRTGELQITDNVDGVHRVALSGAGQQAGINVYPSSLAFGSFPYASSTSTAGAGTALTVAVTNTGNSVIHISSIGTQGDFVETDHCGSVIAAGTQCMFTVTFVPTALGHRTGMLTIRDDVGNGVQQVPLAGDGSPSGLILTPPVINFGAQTVGTQSAAQTATLTNNTGQALTGLAITPSGEFSESDNCGASLANAASCTLNIAVTPTLTGDITGAVTLSSAGIPVSSAVRLRGLLHAAAQTSSASSIGVVALLASATPPGIALSVPTLSFSVTAVGSPSSGQTITITNTSNALPLTGLTISGTNTGEFPFTTNCPSTLPAQASCTVTIQFTPNGYGLRAGILNVDADGGLSSAIPESGMASKGVPGVALASTVNLTMLHGAVTFTATVNASAAMPSGTVTFMDGSTTLGTATLSNGTAALSLSTLAAGTHNITAAYGGDANYLTASSSALSEVVLDFALSPASAAGASQTVASGGAAGYQLVITPTSGTTFPVAAVLSVSGLPQGATATLDTAPWTQISAMSWNVPADTSLSNIALTIHLPAQATSRGDGPTPFTGFAPMSLALLLLPFARRIRAAGRRFTSASLAMLVLASSLIAMGLTACGSHNGFYGQSAQSYTITVTLTAGSVSHSTELTLNVQ